MAEKYRKARKIKPGYQIYIPDLNRWVQVTYVTKSHDFLRGLKRVAFRDHEGRTTSYPLDDYVRSRNRKAAKRL